MNPQTTQKQTTSAPLVTPEHPKGYYTLTEAIELINRLREQRLYG